jgi:DNA-binding NarL/FixJ family response regulator
MDSAGSGGEGAGVGKRKPIRLVVVEDEPLYRDLLCGWLERAGFVVVGVFADPVAALLVTPALSADVALLDIELGSSVSGVELGIGLRRSMPRLGIVLLSNYTRPQLLAALPAEVAGGWSYLSKRTVSDGEALSRAITGAAEGLVVFDAALTGSSVIRAGSPIERLSPRQRQIVALLAQGYSNSAIGERLVLTEKSVENHITRIYQEVGIDAHDPVNHQRVRMALLYLESTTDASPTAARRP